MSLNEMALLATVVAAGAAAGTFVIKYPLPWVRSKIQGFWSMLLAGQKVEMQMEQLVTALVSKEEENQSTFSAITEALNEIRAELKPNGGSSLRDSLDRVERISLTGEQRMRAMIESASQGVMEADEMGEVIYANRTLCIMAGRTPAELQGSGWYNMIDPDTRREVAHSFRNAVQAGRAWEQEFEVVSTDGTHHKVDCNAHRYVSPNDNTIGYLFTIVFVDRARRQEDIMEMRK